MRFKAVLFTLAVSFVVPAFLQSAPSASAAPSGTASTRDASADGACRRKRAKKPEGDSDKPKKKDKEGKKSYGFEL